MKKAASSLVGSISRTVRTPATARKTIGGIDVAHSEVRGHERVIFGEGSGVSEEEVKGVLGVRVVGKVSLCVYECV